MDVYEQQMAILGILYHHSNRKNIKENENYGMSSDALTKYANAFVPSRIAQISAKQNLSEMGYITISDDWIAITPEGRKEFFAFCKSEYIREALIESKGKLVTISAGNKNASNINSKLDDTIKKQLSEIIDFIITHYDTITKLFT